jgi:hypothetical protein
VVRTIVHMLSLFFIVYVVLWLVVYPLWH